MLKFVVDSTEKRDIMRKTSKAATKTGFQLCRSEKDPLCCEGPASDESPHRFRAALLKFLFLLRLPCLQGRGTAAKAAVEGCVR